MTGQGSLFPPGNPNPPSPKPWQTSKIDPARIAGMESADSHADLDWREEFDAEVARLAATGQPFSVYDVLDVVGQPPDSHPSAIGARMGANSKRGVIRKVGTSDRVAHGDLVGKWIGAGA